MEVSASALFLYGLLESRRPELLGREPPAAAVRRAWQGLCRYVLEDGRVGGVSAGTAPRGRSHYLTRPRGTYTWGTGAFLLAACACAQAGL